MKASRSPLEHSLVFLSSQSSAALASELRNSPLSMHSTFANLPTHQNAFVTPDRYPWHSHNHFQTRVELPEDLCHPTRRPRRGPMGRCSVWRLQLAVAKAESSHLFHSSLTLHFCAFGCFRLVVLLSERSLDTELKCYFMSLSLRKQRFAWQRKYIY